MVRVNFGVTPLQRDALCPRFYISYTEWTEAADVFAMPLAGVKLHVADELRQMKSSQKQCPQNHFQP